MDRKAAIRKYKETPIPVGVFAVRSNVSGKVFIGSSVNVPAMLNRVRFQLENGSHPNKTLQQEWKELGATAFVFETLDTLEPPKEAGYDPSEDLQTLEAMWREKLAAGGASVESIETHRRPKT